MKFADTPYFLLKNFLNYKYSVVIPPDPVNELVLLWDGSLFYNRLVDYVIGDYVPPFGVDEFNTLLIQSHYYSEDTKGDFVDSSPNTITISTSGYPVHNTVNAIYGGVSIFFNGTGSLNTNTYSYNLADDWTFDVMIKPSILISKARILKIWNNDATDTGIEMYINTDGSLSLESVELSTIICETSAGVIDTVAMSASDYWKHVVLQKENDIVEIKFHGSQVASAAWSIIPEEVIINSDFSTPSLPYTGSLLITTEESTFTEVGGWTDVDSGNNVDINSTVPGKAYIQSIDGIPTGLQSPGTLNAGSDTLVRFKAKQLTDGGGTIDDRTLIVGSIGSTGDRSVSVTPQLGVENTYECIFRPIGTTMFIGRFADDIVSGSSWSIDDVEIYRIYQNQSIIQDWLLTGDVLPTGPIKTGQTSASLPLINDDMSSTRDMNSEWSSYVLSGNFIIPEEEWEIEPVSWSINNIIINLESPNDPTNFCPVGLPDWDGKWIATSGGATRLHYHFSPSKSMYAGDIYEVSVWVYADDSNSANPWVSVGDIEYDLQDYDFTSIEPSATKQWIKYSVQFTTNSAYDEEGIEIKFYYNSAVLSGFGYIGKPELKRIYEQFSGLHIVDDTYTDHQQIFQHVHTIGDTYEWVVDVASISGGGQELLDDNDMSSWAGIQKPGAPALITGVDSDMSSSSTSWSNGTFSVFDTDTSIPSAMYVVGDGGGSDFCYIPNVLDGTEEKLYYAKIYAKWLGGGTATSVYYGSYNGLEAIQGYYGRFTLSTFGGVYSTTFKSHTGAQGTWFCIGRTVSGLPDAQIQIDDVELFEAIDLPYRDWDLISPASENNYVTRGVTDSGNSSRFLSDATTAVGIYQDIAMVSGTEYAYTLDVDDITLGSVVISAGDYTHTITTTGSHDETFNLTAPTTGFTIWTSGASADFTIDNVNLFKKGTTLSIGQGTDGLLPLDTITTSGISSGTYVAEDTEFTMRTPVEESLDAVINSVSVKHTPRYKNLTFGELYTGFAEEIRFSDTVARFSEPYDVPTEAYHDVNSSIVVSGAPALDYVNYDTTIEMSAAGDIGGIFFYDYHGHEWNFEYNTLESSSTGGYLVGMNHGIFTDGDGVLTVYIENSIENDALTDKQKGFVPVSFETISINENEINIDVKNISTLSGTVAGQFGNVSGGYFDEYEYGEDDVIVNVSDAKKIYFRKDGFFHQWLNEYAVPYFRDTFGYDIDIRGYINTDKTFVYLGKIYPAAGGGDVYNYKIIYEGLKDYVMKIPPRHQRTPNLKEMAEIYFDQLYHKIYSKQKDVMTLNDPMEVDIDYLGYLSKYYGMQDLDNINLEPQRYREFVRDIIHFLKRKGTFADLYVIWKVIGQSNNYLNVYERWVSASTATSAINAFEVIQEHQWLDHLYVSKYTSAGTNIWQPPTDGAGIGWYGDIKPIIDTDLIDVCASELTSGNVKEYPPAVEYAMDDKILSSNYRVELDINNEPISLEGIFPKEIAENLFYSFEFVRPVYRVARYGIVYAPIVNFTGDKVHLYSGKNRQGEFYENVYSWSQSLAFRLAELGAYIGIQCTPSTEWVFEHNLNTHKLMSEFFDFDFKQIVPDSVTYSSNGLSATATFENLSSGYMFLKEVKEPSSDWRVTDSPSTFNWIINHTANNYLEVPAPNNTVIVQMQHGIEDEDGTILEWQKVVVNKLDIIDENTIHVYLEDNDEYRGHINTFIAGNETVQVYTFGASASTTWTVNHNLKQKGLMVACYKTEANPVSGGADITTQVWPHEMTLTSDEQTVITFHEPIIGVVAIMKVGNPDIYEMLIEFEDGLQVSPLYKLYGPLESEATQEELDKYSLDEYAPDPNQLGVTETRILYDTGIAGDFYNDSNYFYMDITLDYDSEMNDIRYLDIWNDEGLLLFRNECSGIYKPSEVDFKIHYRIQIPLGQ